MKKLACLVSLLAVGVVCAAEPIQSGPQPGSKVPGPFKPLNLNGPKAGQPNCIYCLNGANPVVMIFAREDSAALRSLIKKLDAATAANQEARLGTAAIYLTNDPAADASLKAFITADHIQHTILATSPADQPAQYKIAADAAVTVLLYRHTTVKANHAFRTGELTPAAVDAIVAELPKLVAAE
jgi:hypothetical protein